MLFSNSIFFDQFRGLDIVFDSIKLNWGSKKVSFALGFLVEYIYILVLG